MVEMLMLCWYVVASVRLRVDDTHDARGADVYVYARTHVRMRCMKFALATCRTRATQPSEGVHHHSSLCITLL